MKISGAMYYDNTESVNNLSCDEFKRTYARSPTDLCEQLELLFLHDPAETKVRKHDVCIFRLFAEEQVFRFEVLGNILLEIV